jgi:ABC-type sugar transport system substrate-binding protein
LALGQDYVIIPSMPTRSFETMSIWALFSGLQDRQLDIDGIIFIPDQPDQHFEELVSFHEEAGDIPLVLADVYFNLSACDERTRARLPSFVGGDELAGGKLAADIMIDAIGPYQTDPPVIMVINGGNAPWERQRADSFRAQIKVTWPTASFIETPFFNYSRPATFEYMTTMIRENADANRTVRLDAIFACNDDMAIGAHGAMTHMMLEGFGFVRPPQIVGYDGIVEIQEYINSGDPFIAGTVDVKIEEQAQAAMLLMHKLLRSGQRRSEVQLISPRAIRRRSLSTKWSVPKDA